MQMLILHSWCFENKKLNTQIMKPAKQQKILLGYSKKDTINIIYLFLVFINILHTNLPSIKVAKPCLILLAYPGILSDT